MLRRIRRLPSPAFMIASVALILAVGGGSFALAISDKKSDKKIAKKVANQRITARAAHLSVNHANSATNADSAQPEAFAHVSSTGVLDTGNSKNVGSVTLVAGQDEYCFSGISFTPRGGQVTVDFGNANYEAGQFTLGSEPLCPAGTQAVVFTDNSGEGGSAAGFFVVFYR